MTAPIPPTATATGQAHPGAQPNADRAPSPTLDAKDPSFRSTPPPKARQDGSHRSVANRTGARTSAVTSTPNK